MGNILKVEQLGFSLYSRLLANFLWLAVQNTSDKNLGGGLGM